jgi:hypothetical protein
MLCGLRSGLRRQRRRYSVRDRRGTSLLKTSEARLRSSETQEPLLRA